MHIFPAYITIVSFIYFFVLHYMYHNMRNNSDIHMMKLTQNSDTIDHSWVEKLEEYRDIIDPARLSHTTQAL